MLGIVAFDDQTSTFIIPSGAGFEVVFCPGARSTNILATQSDKMVQLAQDGHVDSKRKREAKSATESWLVKKSRSESSGTSTVRIDSTVLVITFLMIACAFGYASMS